MKMSTLKANNWFVCPKNVGLNSPSVFFSTYKADIMPMIKLLCKITLKLISFYPSIRK